MLMKHNSEAQQSGYTAAFYHNILNQELLRFLESGLQFMQNNVPIHTARIVKQWFQQHDLKVLD